MRPTTSAASIFIANLRLVCPWFVGGSETGENDLIAAIEAEAAGVTLAPTPPDALREAAHVHDGRDHPECLCPCCINARTLAAIVADAAPYVAALRAALREGA